MQVGIKHVACIRHDLLCTPYIHRHRRLVDNYCCGDDSEENRFVSRCLSGTLMEKVSSAESNFGLVTTIPYTHTHTHTNTPTRLHTRTHIQCMFYFSPYVDIVFLSPSARAAKNLFTLVCITAIAFCARVCAYIISYQFAHRFWSAHAMLIDKK